MKQPPFYYKNGFEIKVEDYGIKEGIKFNFCPNEEGAIILNPEKTFELVKWLDNSFSSPRVLIPHQIERILRRLLEVNIGVPVALKRGEKQHIKKTLELLPKCKDSNPAEELTKFCTKCGKTKQLKEFAKHPDGFYGRRAECKKCRLTVLREYYHKNKVKINVRRRELRLLKKQKEIPNNA